MGKIQVKAYMTEKEFKMLKELTEIQYRTTTGLIVKLITEEYQREIDGDSLNKHLQNKNYEKLKEDTNHPDDTY